MAKEDRNVVNVDDLERYAKEHLPKYAWDYYSSGACDMQTLRDNVDAFSRIRLRPRVLKQVSQVDLSTTILGQPISSPLVVAPTALQRMAHPDGEEATARACAAANTLMTLSSWATTSIEDVANAAPNGLRWFQLYVYKDRELTASIVRRAEAAGYKALALTVDAPMLGRREADVRNAFSLPPHLSMANFVGDKKKQGFSASSQQESGLAQYVASQIDRDLNWQDIKWLRSITKLPIVVKGIHTAEDARLAVEHGLDAIWVSNHAARQLDGVLAAIDILPEVIQAVQGRVEVYVDGGVRRGTSVFKALALGARAVFIGRPVLWGLAYAGESGVTKVLQLLNNELHLAMTLSGCKKIDEIGLSHIVQTQSRL